MKSTLTNFTSPWPGRVPPAGGMKTIPRPSELGVAAASVVIEFHELISDVVLHLAAVVLEEHPPELPQPLSAIADESIGGAIAAGARQLLYRVVPQG